MRSLLAIVGLLATLPVQAGAVGIGRSPHFVFHYPALDAPTINQTAQVLERERAKILDLYRVWDMPRVHIWFYTDHAELEAAARDVAGGLPSWAFGFVTREDRIDCMSPNAQGWGPYGRRVRDIVHEFVHAMSLHLNPRFANNPRWLWESIALYEAGQSVDPAVLPYMTQGTPPTLAELNRVSDTRLYEVGFTIGEFIVKRWGHPKLRELLLANGDTASVLGVTLPEFEAGWAAFLRKNYKP